MPPETAKSIRIYCQSHYNLLRQHHAFQWGGLMADEVNRILSIRFRNINANSVSSCRRITTKA